MPIILNDEQCKLLASSIKKTKQSSITDYLVKKRFFEACLLMEKQDPETKKTIAHFYARAIVAAMRGHFCGLANSFLRMGKSLSRLDLSADENLVDYLCESILQTEKKHTQAFKDLLIKLANEEQSLVIITWAYKDTLLYTLNDSSILNAKRKKIIDDNHQRLYKKAASELKTATGLASFPTLAPGLVLMALVYFSLEAREYNTSTSLGAAFISTLLILLAKNSIETKFSFDKFKKFLIDSLVTSIEMPSFNFEESGPKKQYFIKSTSATAELTSSSNIELVRVSVLSAPLAPAENNDAYYRKPKRWHFLKSTSPEVKSASSNKENDIASADYFGAQFSNSYLVKTKASYLSANSKLYAIWYTPELSAQPENCLSMEILCGVFTEGCLVNSEKTRRIKRLTIENYLGNFYEIKSGQTVARVLGKEVKTVNGTFILFCLFVPSGLHGGNQQNMRHIEKLNYRISQILENNKISLEVSDGHLSTQPSKPINNL